MQAVSQMSALHFILFYSNILILCSQCILIASYTLTPSQSIVDGDTLISQGGTFKLGFFSPSNRSNNRYVGIWYNTIPGQTIVWVANRDSPVNDTSGALKIGSTGDLVIVVNKTDRVIWSSNSSKSVQQNLVLEFLESGNLALRDLTDVSNRSLWQSFDFPTDTMLPGMKIGWNSRTATTRYLTSWKNIEDPSSGDYKYGLELTETVLRKGSDIYFRGGSWNGVQGRGSPESQPDQKIRFEFVNASDETYFVYHMVDRSSLLRLMLTQTNTEGRAQRVTWDDKTDTWVTQASQPRDRCDLYALCGAHATCDLVYINFCRCLEGFKPKSPQNWSEQDWSQGCERQVSLNCSKGDGFRKYTEIKLPETNGSFINNSMNLEECRVSCLSNCSCMAYANSDVRGNGSGCILWMTDLIDMRQLPGVGQDLYIRMAASETGEWEESRTKSKLKGRVLVASIVSIAGAFVLALGIYCIWKKITSQGDTERDDLELPLYDLATIASATNNFSAENKLGEGGFGPVYKGILAGNEEIAVKRLSTNSIQGINEFWNEVILIAKLQHKNLVRILGCCIKKEEMMLIYEYVQNNSLDTYIFDETKKRLLDWEMRFQIILGITRGLLYLHHDSRLRIIHRDLKAGNILLDREMVPKISDFGMARIYRVDNHQERTKRVVGTHGYMSPEYMLNGRFSLKSDVFSFGVMVLEIISGKRNRGFKHPDRHVNLLGHAWRLWREEKSMELLDASINNFSHVQDVLRCIHVGLLCVQKVSELRPSMSSVLLMLSSENAVLPVPQVPGFYVDISTSLDQNFGSSDEVPGFSNEASMTILEGR